MGRHLTVGLVQTGLYPEHEEQAIRVVEEKARTAAAEGAEIVCLPEHWLISRVVEGDDGFYEHFGKLARELGVHINLGGVYERQDGETHFLSPTLGPSGKIISRQRKVHLYRGEKRKAKPGSSFDPFVVGDVKVGVMVCHDVVFPESGRALAMSGAELLLVPSLIVSEGIEPWQVYLKARALENRVPVVSANAYHPPRFLGKSSIVDLEYDSKQNVMKLRERVALGGKTVLVGRIEVDPLVKLRAERLGERRPEAYGWGKQI